MNGTVNRPQPRDFIIKTDERGEVVDWTAYKKAVFHSINPDELQTRTLPCSTRKIPARLSWGKFSKRRTYEGTYEYVLQILIDGKHVGDAVDEGHGGGIWLRPNWGGDGNRDADAAVRDVQNEYDVLLAQHYGRTEPDSLGGSEETLWNHLVEEIEISKTFARIVKAGKKTICLPTEWNGSPLRPDERFGLKEWEDVSYVTLGVPLATALANAETLKTKTKVSHVWNGTEWQAL